ncbi:MAG: fatty acid desaturase, partial [Terriglobales bacterium]
TALPRDEFFEFPAVDRARHMSDAGAVPATNAAAWRAMVAPYLKPDARRAVMQLSTTGLLFLAVMAGMLTALEHGILAATLLAPPAAILLMRLFTFQHDCGHGSFFAARRVNDCIGQLLGVLTLTPYSAWRGKHAAHHASAGNLDRRGVGDVTTLTVSEYVALPAWRRLAYRLYRHPLVMFGVAPSWLFLVRYRVPTGDPRRHWREWLSVVGTDAALGAVLAALVVTLGPLPVLLGWLPVALLAATIGVWLFYIQHQFEETYWEPQRDWDFRAAALQGASFYDLPAALHWMTGNIGFHHIHHLSSRIPNYRLRECHEANPALQAAPRLTLRESLRCARLALWDAEGRRLVPFGKVRTARAEERCGSCGRGAGLWRPHAPSIRRLAASVTRRIRP